LSWLLKGRNGLRSTAMVIRVIYLRTLWGHDIDRSARISFSAYLDRTNPRGIKIGGETIVTRGAMILSHDFCRATRSNTVIGKRCFIGVGAIVMPGVHIGDEVVVGAGAVVIRDVASGHLVAGNPARIIKRIRTRAYGQILTTDEPPMHDRSAGV
jgi:acetyltransferase-like isoleucine patch superfamily enzyme